MTTPDRPILVFPAATRVERERSRYVPARLVTPSAERQEYRLAPKFERLQRAYAERRMSLATDVAGTAPELVLVIEIAGTVDEFIRAVQRIPGLEWLGEMDETLDPDDDFFDPSDDAAKPISGELFLVMSDETAFSQMLSLWRRYVQDPVAPFDYGYGRWKSVFSHLKDIRPWDVDDRLTRTAVLEDWRQRVRAGQEEVRTEVELWFRRRPEAREAAVTAVSALVEADGGRLLGQAVIPEIAYHALLAELPITAVDRVLESRDSQLVRSNEVMLFRPVGQAAAPLPEEEPLSGEVSLQRSPPAGEPRVALLDGLPLENHTVLSGRLVVDDPEDWASSYPAEDRVHGTAMASLVVHGELDDQPAPADAPVYVRPILRPDIGDWRHPRVECVPEDVLAVDLIHRAVRRIFDGEGQEAPAAPSVRIVNLSVGDQALPFVRAMSPLARLIDWLAWRYPALFIVSAGNRAREIQFSAPPAALDALTETELEAETLRVLANEVHRRRLLSPAEAINALTVGAAYADASTGALSSGQRSLVEIAQLPAPTSALGLGFRRGVKPDVLFPGGRQFYRDMASDSASTTVHAVDVNRAPGQRVATPGAIPGDLTATRYSRGTSNSTALASRAAAMIYDAVITNAGALPGARSAPD